MCAALEVVTYESGGNLHRYVGDGDNAENQTHLDDAKVKELK